jgi:alanine-glyoxylate transaminase/serine-glyoxylate transaminase/serine-pyruvate transaminase
MLPPGMSFNAVSEKALNAAKTAKLPRSFFQWDDMLTMYKQGFFPYTPATQMLYGLDVSIQMLHEEGLDNVFARHDRLAEATRRAVRGWGLEILCRDPKYYSPSVTAVLLPDGHDADQFRAVALNTFNIAYGASFGPYAKKYFRIGHMGDVNDTMMLGALAATEMAFALAGVPHKKGGVQAAIDYIVSTQPPRRAWRRSRFSALSRNSGTQPPFRHCERGEAIQRAAPHWLASSLRSSQ